MKPLMRAFVARMDAGLFLARTQPFTSAAHQLNRFHHFIDKTKTVGLSASKMRPVDEQVHAQSCVRTCQTRIDETTAGTNPMRTFRIAELRFRNSQSKVAHRSQASSSGDGSAVHSRNRRLGEIVEPPKDPGDALGVGQISRQASCQVVTSTLQDQVPNKTPFPCP